MEALRNFCYKVNLMIEGDDVVEEVIAQMQKWGYVDEDGLWVYLSEDDEPVEFMGSHESL